MPVGNELEWQIMQIMVLFVLGGIHELIHIQLLVYFPVLFISP